MTSDVNTYVATLEAENKIKLLEPFKGAKLHHQMQCLVCDHEWSATPVSKRQALKKYGTTGCPNCSTRSKTDAYTNSRTKNLSILKERGLEVLTPGYDGRRHITDDLAYTTLLVRNNTCGHTFECSPTNLLTNQVNCAVCGAQQRTKTITEWSKANSAKWKETATEWQLYKAEVARLTEETYKIHSALINPKNLPRGKAGVEGAFHLDHIVPKRFCFDNDIPAELCAHYSNLQMIGWRENVGSRAHIKGTIPPLFLPHLSSQTKLQTYVDQLIQILPSAKPFVQIEGTIATVYDDQSNRAVYVIQTTQEFANQKTALAIYRALKPTPVNFTILFEDELTNTQLLAAKLKHYTSNGVTKRIHARDCEVRECSKHEKRTLLNANHVQGNDNAPVAYGAYYNNELVAVMTFSAPRVALGQKGNIDRDGVWELSRFCTDVSYRIPGIASKLLTHFKRTHTWKEIYSYADKRWSVGNMYERLGFELTADNPPDYFYVINGVRKHRWNYRKDVLKNTLEHYDSSATEYQNMVDHGYWRVWDCGTLKFTMRNIANCK